MSMLLISFSSENKRNIQQLVISILSALGGRSFCVQVTSFVLRLEDLFLFILSQININKYQYKSVSTYQCQLLTQTDTQAEDVILVLSLTALRIEF